MTKNKSSFNLTFWIFLATILGILTGFALGPEASSLAILGNLFMQLIKMVIVPLIFFSIAVGASSLDDIRSAGKIGFQAMTFYLGTTVLAIVFSLIFGYLLEPGKGADPKSLPGEVVLESRQIDETKDVTAPQPGIADILKGVIPSNPAQSMVEGNMLQIIFFSVFLGLSISSLSPDLKKPAVDILNSFNEALIVMVKWIMVTAPIGVFGLMAETVGVHGVSTLLSLMKLLLVYIFCVVFHFFTVYFSMAKFIGKVSFKDFISGMEKPLLVSFTTASSLVTLPTSMETAREEFNVSKEVSSFVLPLGATINMDGSAINFGLYAVFGLQFLGLDFTFEKALLIILTATLGSIGTAGVPGPSLLTVSVLNAAGVPLTILPLFIATDRIFDMIRTSINISGDITCSIVVDRLNPHKKLSEEKNSHVQTH